VVLSLVASGLLAAPTAAAPRKPPVARKPAPAKKRPPAKKKAPAKKTNPKGIDSAGIGEKPAPRQKR
jgi:hypothetical protein